MLSEFLEPDIYFISFNLQLGLCKGKNTTQDSMWIL